MYTLIAFATEWGSKHGGINSFNTDFLKQFGAAYHHGVQIICVVTQHTREAEEEAVKAHVRLIALPYVPQSRTFDSAIGSLSIDLLDKARVTFDPEHTIWLGHDLITGEAAIAAAKVRCGRSAVIHHMSYRDYESYAEDSKSALEKTEKQTEILKHADLVLAIGPLLRDAASDRTEGSKPIHMLIPGLSEINTRETPRTFVAFLSGRLTPDAARIKQSHLGIAAFATAEAKAHTEGGPEALKRRPTLLLRGVDFENRISEASLSTVQNPETDLKDFTEYYGKGVINLQALPYTESRAQLYAELSGASVALMPSWHEGFGLVAWEAIAAGVPLIVGENTGVYRLLEDELFGAQKGFLYPLDVRGQSQFPYFRPEDLEATVTAISSVALNPANARNRASMLRNMLLEKYTWTRCCESAAEAFGWQLQKGSVPDRTPDIVQEITHQSTTATAVIPVDDGPLKIPRGQWQPKAGMADSQLLRAEEQLLPFDERRKPDVEKLSEWAADGDMPLTVRLITGDGGQGKTRLAIHVCQQLGAEGWHSGFLDSSLKVNEISLLWRDLSRLDQPIFIVVDYAETRQEAFLALLKAALENPINKPVRMLLLARNGGEWWDNLPSTNSSCEALLNGPATTGPFGLPPLYEQQQDRQQAFANALSAFAKILQVESPQILPELVGDQFQRPLFVQMAALLALYGERPTTIQGLTKALLNHERRYWVGLLTSFNWPDPGRQAEDLLALATLAGGFATSKDAEDFWTAAKATGLTTGEFNALFRKLAALYPGTQGLQALRPDLLGEALVAQAVLRPDGDVLLDAVLSSSATQSVRRNALTIIARMSDERADVHETIVTVLSRRLENCTAELVAVGTETASRLPELAEDAFQRLSSSAKSQVAGSLRRLLPEKSVQLAGLSCLVFGHLFHKARQKYEHKQNNPDRMYEYANALDSYGVVLCDSGRYEDAREIGHKAILIMRKLMTKDRSKYEAPFARSLHNYAVYLSELGDDEEALKYDYEALQIRKRLVANDTTRFEPDYADSLDNYGTQLSYLGRYKEALPYTEEALKIHERWAQKDPNSFDALCARSLSNYASDLNNLGEGERALACLSRALTIRQKLTEKNPDGFEPEYARSLEGLAIYLINLSANEDALSYLQKANEIRTRLAQRRPNVFLEGLAYNLCSIRFLTWLFTHTPGGIKDNVETLVLGIPRHQQSAVQLYWAFVNACEDTQLATRLNRFRFVTETWKDLSSRDKESAKLNRFCAAAWRSKFDSLSNDNWQADWCRYLADRKDSVPFWMREVARRLDFEFPTRY
jgi:glycosyltransferase involved in cell wall biosynthesis/tetratricopeptide (TPR) repeat protein